MLAQAVAEALPEMRAQAERLMTSTCTIRADDGGEPVTDPDTGAVTWTAGTLIYSGKCRLRQPGTWGRQAQAGGEQVSPGSYQLSVPFDVTGLARTQLVTIDDSPDPAAVGKKLEIRETPPLGDNLSARRLICEEAS